MDTEPGPECSWKCLSNFLVSCRKKVKLCLFGGCYLAVFCFVTHWVSATPPDFRGSRKLLLLQIRPACTFGLVTSVVFLALILGIKLSQLTPSVPCRSNRKPLLLFPRLLFLPMMQGHARRWGAQERIASPAVPLEHSSLSWPHPFPCHPQGWLPHTVPVLPQSMGELFHAQS